MDPSCAGVQLRLEFFLAWTQDKFTGLSGFSEDKIKSVKLLLVDLKKKGKKVERICCSG